MLDEVDEIIFDFKRKMYSWLRKTNEDDRFQKLQERQRLI